MDPICCIQFLWKGSTNLYPVLFLYTLSNNSVHKTVKGMLEGYFENVFNISSEALMNLFCLICEVGITGAQECVEFSILIQSSGFDSLDK